MTGQTEATAPATDKQTGTCVFVLGAGCSADCNAPTMQRFMRTAREYQRAANDSLRQDYQAVVTFRRECLQVAYILASNWDNIEQLFTQAHLRRLLESDETALVEQLGRVIWDVYRRVRPKKDVGYDFFANWLKFLVDEWNAEGSPRPVVITTNYDVHLETALLRNNAPAPVYPGELHIDAKHPFCEAANPENLLPKTSRTVSIGHDNKRYRSIEVVKLHGSVNWFRVGGKDAPQCKTHLSSNNTVEAQWLRYAFFQCQSDSFVQQLETLTPLIVPPSLGKTSLDSQIRRQWERAAHAFAYAHEIAFIGYSFPETDTFMTRLLAEGLRRNERLEEIHIINSDGTDAWKDRIRKLFASTWWEMNVNAYTVQFDEAARKLATEGGPAKQRSLTRILGSYAWR